MKPEFLYYVLSSDQFFAYNMQHTKGAKMPRGNKPEILKYPVPVPPLEVQGEIVRILDNFSALTAELEARRAQYEYYRDALLDGARQEGSEVPIGELGQVVTGRTPKSSEASFWGKEMDFITPSDIKNGMKEVSSPTRMLSKRGAENMNKVILPERSILVTCIGADMGKTVINANECATNQQINSLVPDCSKVLPDYVFHVLTAMRDQLRKQGERSGGTMPIINKTDFSKIPLPIPPLETQKRTAGQLDKFDALVNDLTSGLPAEISARRKQYEYYRDRLLTFEEAAA
ncbi:restriction endonuclease subunit S [Nesterenkonia ebinurensis]|uniref:restriction endonuclease subunit S n=1 Tax=Nesterenkonia ebinurensis TaxID=2608252 RepID=UPI001CC68811|nr:restriction endonuclease subunit S [Nesterenkonia ebinurensis]